MPLGNPSLTHLLLLDLEWRYLLALGDEILQRIKTDSDLTADEMEGWVKKAEAFGDLAKLSIDEMKHGAEQVQKQQSINALVPFVNKAHLN